MMTLRHLAPTDLLSAGLLAVGVASCSSSEAKPIAEAAPTDDAALPCLFCSDAGGELPLAVKVKGRIDQVCSSLDGCHGQGQGGLALSSGNEFATMVNVPSTQVPSLLRVAPGNPAASYVYRKIACDGGYVLSCMPKGGGFDANLARLFFDWIEAGAPTQ
ncbi:MAG: hypothetical protein M3O50_18885 [Myxococcota bacterium]|nr:hypothetical protein [Myxococcota bacterium]